MVCEDEYMNMRSPQLLIVTNIYYMTVIISSPAWATMQGWQEGGGGAEGGKIPGAQLLRRPKILVKRQVMGGTVKRAGGL